MYQSQPTKDYSGVMLEIFLKTLTRIEIRIGISFRHVFFSVLFGQFHVLVACLRHAHADHQDPHLCHTQNQNQQAIGAGQIQKWRRFLQERLPTHQRWQNLLLDKRRGQCKQQSFDESVDHGVERIKYTDVYCSNQKRCDVSPSEVVVKRQLCCRRFESK
jgi:hypothetical protein